MNRRTFIQLTGSAFGGLILNSSILAEIKEEPKWIRFKNQMPNPGQKILLLKLAKKEWIKYNNDLLNFFSLYGGIVEYPSICSRNDIYYKKPDFAMKVDFNYIQDVNSAHNNKLRYKDDLSQKTINHLMQNTNYIKKYSLLMSHSSNFLLLWFLQTENRFGSLNERCYWIPVEENYPQTLPPFPNIQG